MAWKQFRLWFNVLTCKTQILKVLISWYCWKGEMSVNLKSGALACSTATSNMLILRRVPPDPDLYRGGLVEWGISKQKSNWKVIRCHGGGENSTVHGPYQGLDRTKLSLVLYIGTWCSIQGLCLGHLGLYDIASGQLNHNDLFHTECLMSHLSDCLN